MTDVRPTAATFRIGQSQTMAVSGNALGQRTSHLMTGTDINLQA